MNKTQVKRYIKNETPQILECLGLSDQHIVYSFRAKGDDRGETITSFPYKDISIILTPSNIDNEIELRQVLLHEYGHVILAPFTHYNERVNKSLTKKQVAALDEHMALMEEIVTTHLERIFVRLGV